MFSTLRGNIVSPEFSGWWSMFSTLSENIVSPEFSDLDCGIRSDIMEQFLAITEVLYTAVQIQGEGGFNSPKILTHHPKKYMLPFPKNSLTYTHVTQR